jgi:hypothetical protein
MVMGTGNNKELTMTKTNRIAAALALATATFATGCAIDSTDCTDQDCSAIEAQRFAPENDFEVQPSDEGRPAAQRLRDPQLKQYPKTLPPLEQWVLRMDAGTADDCDYRFADYVAGDSGTLEVRGCEDSVITAVLADSDGRPVAVAFDAFNVEETRWMLLGLDISEDAPLSVEQERMLIQAEDDSIRSAPAVHAEPVNEIAPAFAPEDLAPHNM